MKLHAHKLQSAIWSLCVAIFLFLPQVSSAIPAFARQYGTSCSTCHSDFPKLNDFGKAFKDAGFKFPTDDAGFMKIPPRLLGAPAQKELFPHTIWPGSIPGLPPIGLRMNTFFQKTAGNRGNFDALVPAWHRCAVHPQDGLQYRACSASLPPEILAAISRSGWTKT